MLWHRRDVLAACGYVAAMLVFVYAVANPSVGYGSDAANAAILAGLALVHLATGVVGARWWLVLLPALAVLAAVPAGDPAEGYEPFPIWFGLAVASLPGAALIVAGVVAAKLARRS